MKIIIKFILILTLIIGFYNWSNGQTVCNTAKLDLGKVDPYRMEVTYNKTSHLIFPAGIRYVDLGSEYLIAGKAEDAENVLRIKAALRDFKEETNFSVITNDGRFYNFNVVYNGSPVTLNYDLLQMQKSTDRENGNDVLFEELGSNAPSLTGLLMQSIYKKNKRVIRHIRAESYGIQFLLKGIYIHNGLFYFHTELRNNSNVPFKIDFVTFRVIDKKLAKRTVVQEKTLVPIRIYKPLDDIAGNTAEQNVFLLDQFTIAGDKALMIEIFEKNGGRQQVLRVENADLVHAKLIEDMHLKIN
ncbi:conjugative transposon protein TraN [Agriterribacter sp.]|uniref:conjugative transposon protein TraN n=1 Tax=Agriterribacter sp. TaxID=2821509 RepID=UPI002CAE843E|nr:conjugative transposon protein TraN [Agriterribacter sp.]HRO46295.1 conjugative transposon protein TraN [Agriterribacter sp.]HRQ18501.1 conjugative transposon protein TraN [Agriterribacter sp.]